jgi:hypothetical protein
VGDGDDDQDDEQPEPVASSTSDATGRDAKHAGVPLRGGRAVEGAGRRFSTPSRPALRAASGRLPTRQRHRRRQAPSVASITSVALITTVTADPLTAQAVRPTLA